jgi:hypothetical protein
MVKVMNTWFVMLFVVPHALQVGILLPEMRADPAFLLHLLL